MSVDTDTDAPRNALAALRALTTAFSVSSLYPDPVGQPGFVTAIAALSERSEPVILVIGPGSVLFDGDELDAENETTHRLARELFVRDIDVVRIIPPVKESDLLAFFRSLSRDEDEIRDEGGLRSALRRAGSTTIEVYERGMLAAGSGGDREHFNAEGEQVNLDDLSDLAAAAHRGMPPSVLASMLSHPEDYEDGAVDTFLEGLSELYDHAVPEANTHIESLNPLDGSAVDPWRGFRAFMEAFFFLDRDSRLSILETVLSSRSSWGRLLVDQLSGADLADYYNDLSDAGREALAAYAAVVSSESGRPVDQIISEMPSQAEVSSARQIVATRISEVLADAKAERAVVEELVESIGKQLAASPDDERLEIEVLRGLFECEDRNDRFKRIVRVWSGRVALHLRNGDIVKGSGLMSAITNNPPYERDRAHLVRDGLVRIADHNTVRMVLDRESGSEPSDETWELFAALGTPAVGPLVTTLAHEEDGQRRRLLTELLAAAARPDPAVLDPYLNNQPWYVLRNIATVLGKTGRSSAVAGTRRLLAHEDHRVRVEAIRALVRLVGDSVSPTLVRLLSDESDRVRQTAASLIRSIGGTEIDQLLVTELESGRLAIDESQVVVRILGSRQSAGARRLLEKLASRRFVFGARRQIRTTAREALEPTT